jgi:hypothetical protein
MFESCGYWEFNKNTEKLEIIYEKFNEKFISMPISDNNPRMVYRINELLCLECDKFIPREKTPQLILTKPKVIKKTPQVIIKPIK